MVINNYELEKVNDIRKGKQYIDEDAGNVIKIGSVDKTKLTNYHFIATFKYDPIFDGYWTYDCVILHLEKCIDYLKVLHPQY